MPIAIRSFSAALAALAVAALAGCGGGGGGGGNAAVSLTRWLPSNAPGYAAADLAALRDDLGLDEESDPLERPDNALAAAAGAVLGPLALSLPDAVDLRFATEVATAREGEGAITAIATSADTGEIGSALGDAGYRDRGGVLVGEPGSPAFKLVVGIVFAAPSPTPLRAIPDEPADEAPDPLIEDLSGPYVETRVSRAPCARIEGATGLADGSGEVVVLLDPGADAPDLRTQDTPTVKVGEPEADGETLSVEAEPADPDGPVLRFAAPEALRTGAVTTAC